MPASNDTEEISSIRLPDDAERHDLRRALGGGVLITFLVGYVDLKTGYEVSLAAFYAAPVIFVLWHGSRWTAVFMTLFAVLVRFGADWANHHPYSSEWIRLWNAGVAVIFLVLIVIGFSALKAQLKQSRTRITQLEDTLPICSGCKKIEDENGDWSSLETYLEEHMGSKPGQKLCPDCARKFYVKKMGPGSGIR